MVGVSSSSWTAPTSSSALRSVTAKLASRRSGPMNWATSPMRAIIVAVSAPPSSSHTARETVAPKTQSVTTLCTTDPVIEAATALRMARRWFSIPSASGS